MNITHIACVDIQGGAARSTYRLHRGLLEIGQNSCLFVEHRLSDDPTVREFRYPTGFFERVQRRSYRWSMERTGGRQIARRKAHASYYSDDRSQHRSIQLGQIPPWEILHLHWISNFLDYRSFFKHVPQDRPIVWTLHDMNPFTGGCHFDGGCGRFTERCGACPQLESSVPNDFSRASWYRKRSGYASLRPEVLRLVTPSNWLAQKVRESSLLGRYRVDVIPYGLDTEIFRPRDRAAARDVLGIRQDADVVLFLADYAPEARKGLTLLTDAIRELPDSANLCLLVLGRGRIELPPGVAKIHLEYVSSDRILSMIYSAADVFALPALQDNLPNTALEALACGLPIVAFSAGGIPEIFRDGIEGRLVSSGEVAALRSAVSEVLQDKALRAAMAANARRRAVEQYGLKLQAMRYLELYRSLAALRI